jgi:hypothetical protein
VVHAAASSSPSGNTKNRWIIEKGHEMTGLEPLGLALVLCDFVHVDPLSGRRTMLGTFSEIEATSFPVVYPRMAIFAAVTDGRGIMPITIRLLASDEEQTIIWSDTQEVEFDDPQRAYELDVEVLDTPFENPGIFRLQLLVAEAIIMERSIVLFEADSQEE